MRVWDGEGAALVAKLRSRAMGAPMVLNKAKWQLHLQLGQSGLTRAKDSRAMFELDLRNAADVEVRGMLAARVCRRRHHAITIPRSG